ncbi:uncharacterized protein METZ01_LOCUS348193, partial [marine metagenome]
MFAIVKDGAITQTGSSVKKMFPNTSFAGGPNADFLRENNVYDIVNGERKDDQYYFVTQGDITLVDGVPTQAFTSIAKRLVDEDAKDEDGNNILDSDGNQVINYGLKTSKT